MNSYNITYKTSARVTALLLSLFLACSGAMAQDYTNRYQDSLHIFHFTYGENNNGRTEVYDSEITNTSSISIVHHPAMWYWFRNRLTDEQKALDTFDEASEGWMETMNGTKIQAAHVYVDTLYVHKGDTIHLVLPYTDNLNESSNSSFFDLMNYFRWYDYKSDGLFECNLSKGSNTVRDLLTPTLNSSGSVINGGRGYRFKNGYVSGGLNRYPTNSTNIQTNFRYIAPRLKYMTFYYPTDDEFNSISSSSTFNGGTNDYYLVACDVSSYMDFAPLNDTYDRSKSRVYAFGTGASGTTGYNEPTLSARAIFYIVGVDDVDTSSKDLPDGLQYYMNLKSATYQGGTNTGEEKYLEEYEITYPSRRITNNTNELVALSKPAHAYAIPDVVTGDGTNAVELTAKIADNDNSAGLALVHVGAGTVGQQAIETTSTVSGYNRSISFCKSGSTPVLANIPSSGDYKSSSSTTTFTSWPTWEVEDGSTATILVTKTVDNTTYNIARFKLTFKDEFTPLTQTQVAGLSSLKGDENYWWKDLTYRSPEYMEENYELLTSITFDYDDNITADKFYGETDDPTAYRENIYPFPFDWESSTYSYISGLGREEQFNYPGSDGYRITPGEYAIANRYYYDNISQYVPMDKGKNTSSGFWVNVDATDAPGTLAILEFGEDLCPSSKLFVTAWMKGLNNSTSASSALLLTITGVYPDGTEVPVYRYSSSQVRHTNTLTKEKDNSGNDIDPSVSGIGEGSNDWFQLYFSFINQPNTGFDHYALRIDNRSERSGGADYVYDEVKVYVERPEVEMVQLDPICATSDDDKSAMRLDIDYEIMMSRLGFEPSDYTNDTDKETAQTASVDFVIINETQYRNALAAYDGDGENYTTYQEEAFKAALVTFYDAEGEEHQFPTLDFYCNYSLNQEYDEEAPGRNIVTFDSNDEGYFYSRTVSPTEYMSVDCLTDMMAYTEYMILLEPHTQTDKSSEQKLEEFIELMDDQCAIKTEFYLSSETILKLNGETLDPSADYCAGQEFVISPEVTYTDPETGETIYIDGVYFDWFFGSRDKYVAANEDYNGVSLEEALIMFRTYYPDAEELSETETPTTGENASQDFTQDHYDIIAYYLSQERYGGMNNMLVLHRSHLDMRVLNTGLELVIQPIEMTFEDENIEICFGYVPLSLSASGDAPTLKAGFSNINYPDDDYEPCLRLGLAQFEKCGETTPFTINLHGATYVTEEGVDIDHLGVAEGMEMLILVDTDDPAYRDIILGKENEDEIVIGKVARLYATTDNGNDPRQDTPNIGSYMQIYFYGKDDLENDPSITPFTVREGYYYVVSVYFQEKGSFDGGEQTVGSACWGTFPLEMKIVPEYLVWTGDKDDNWNNDNHWERVSATSINGATNVNSPYFTDGNNTNTNGFVPMLFTKVIIPRDSEAELYMAGFIEGTDNMLSWEGDDDTANHDDVSESPTSNIVYDMMLYETVSGTTSSFKTEHYRVNLCDQLHLESGAQLLHSEQLIYNKAWTDVELAQGPWTLVSTPLNAVVSGDWYTKSETGTETAEYFTDITFSNTYNDRYDPMVYQRNWSNSGNKIVYTAGTDKTVPTYASTGWSSVYNDASVSQQAGEGFSIKASNGGTSNLMFRFPKADTSYDVATTTLTRTNAGRLLISDLVDRSNTEDKDDDEDVYTGKDIEVTLTQTGNGYYIIGNPFTAPMSMKEFMTKNEDIKGYWTEATYGPVVGTGEVNSWGTSDCLIEPYSAFFVTTDENDLNPLDDSPVTVTFTKDMQMLEMELEQAPVRRQTNFAIRATGEGGTTSASIAYAEDAADDYSAGEDAVLMEDVSWQCDDMPLVYTVAGEKAVSVNSLKRLVLIPVGVFADEGSLYTLSFVGVGNLDEPALVDTYEGTETPLTEGFDLEVEGATHGRFFIKVSAPIHTDIEETAAEVDAVSAYSPVQGTVVVCSDAGLENVEIYSVGGMLLNHTSVGGNLSCTINGLASGIAIVKVKTTEGMTVKKIRVR